MRNASWLAEPLAIGDVITVPFNGQAAEILLRSLNCTASGIGFLVPVRIVDVRGPPENPQFLIKTGSLALEIAEQRVTFSLTGPFVRESIQPGMYLPLNEISELAIRASTLSSPFTLKRLQRSGKNQRPERAGPR